MIAHDGVSWGWLMMVLCPQPFHELVDDLARVGNDREYENVVLAHTAAALTRSVSRRPAILDSRSPR